MTHLRPIYLQMVWMPELGWCAYFAAGVRGPFFDPPLDLRALGDAELLYRGRSAPC